jgi:hypothetical protein
MTVTRGTDPAAAGGSSGARESAARLEAAGQLLRVPFVTVFEYLRVGLCSI